jgi:hypothetical protein
MKKLLSLTIVLMLLLTGCNRENLVKAKESMAKNENGPEIQVSILFDNSLSYQAFVSDTLSQVKKLFQYLVSQYSEDETIRVSLILIDTKASIIFNGKVRDLQRAYEDVTRVLKEGQTRYTNLTDAVNRSLYFFEEGQAKRKILMVFSDLKASTPDYYPQDAKVVPPPKDFPWARLQKAQVETYAFYVPYEEWQTWMPVVKEKGVRLIAKLPEEMKTESAYKLLIADHE